MAERASPRAAAACHAMSQILDGLTPEEARDATVSLLARVIMCEAPTKYHALRWARIVTRDIAENVELNWPVIDRERAANRGQQPSWEDER